MQTDVTQTIAEKVKKLDPEQQKQVLEFVESKFFAIEKKETRPIWEVIAEISSEIPDEEWEKLPSDGSVNHDHYLYGAPKKYK